MRLSKHSSLSTEDYRRLLRLRARILASRKSGCEDWCMAGRLAFYKWLYLSGRMNEDMRRRTA